MVSLCPYLKSCKHNSSVYIPLIFLLNWELIDQHEPKGAIIFLDLLKVSIDLSIIQTKG